MLTQLLAGVGRFLNFSRKNRPKQEGGKKENTKAVGAEGDVENTLVIEIPDLKEAMIRFRNNHAFVQNRIAEIDRLVEALKMR